MEEDKNKETVNERRVARTRTQRLMEKCKGTVKGSFILFTGIHVSTIAIAAVHFKDCPVEPDIPKYLLTLGILGVITKVVTLLKDFLLKYMPVNPILSFLMTADVAALILGSYYIYGEFKPNYDPLSGDKYCNKTLYLFAFIYITVIYCIILFVMLSIICFILGIIVLDKYGRKDFDEINTPQVA